MTMARLTGRSAPKPAPPADPSPVTIEAAPAPAQTPPAPATRQPARAELDTLTLALINEAPAPRAQRARSTTPQAAPAPVARPSPARRVPWRAIGLGVASTAALVIVAFAPRLRGAIAAPARQPDGTPAAVPSNLDQWLAKNQGGDGWLI